ncbi:MAG: nucleotidyl transferase AbiEii/AbiGii toxin family protein [Burkholderiales bacterium]|nr:nucleotidyl transferase AbiEii/AbiGii toxin family protein [Burkholderiales bacterium]
MKADLAASIHARLSVRAKERGEVFQDVLTRYGVERFLYRLSCTPARDTLWLKGALLFDLWFDVPHRPTRDADFLGFGPSDQAALETSVRDACVIEVPDGMAYDPQSIRVREIREDARYAGLRVTLTGTLKKARCPVQLDVGYGDAVTPGPEEAVYPTLLDDLPAPRLRVYPRETVIAEKLEAIATLGMANSRMKDYFDLRALAHEGAADPRVLSEAIRATFERRRTPLPAGMLLGLEDQFGRDRVKQSQWNAFLAKNRLDAPPLDVVVREVRSFLEVPLNQASKRQEPV